MARSPLLKLLLAALALVPLPQAARAEEPRERVGLFTTLPLYWAETRSLSDLLGPETAAHWARTALERDYTLVPLDVLGGEAATLDGLDDLLLAQPRMLAPAENVALDAWVRGGGRLLLFADPMMTGESIFALGDKRRPQDVALLSPILAHWGLELRFDDSAPGGETLVAWNGAELPVNRAGILAPVAGGTACEILAEGLVARCALGAGTATIVADAALFDADAASPAREQAFAALLAAAFTR